LWGATDSEWAPGDPVTAGRSAHAVSDSVRHWQPTPCAQPAVTHADRCGPRRPITIPILKLKPTGGRVSSALRHRCECRSAEPIGARRSASAGSELRARHRRSTRRRWAAGPSQGGSSLAAARLHQERLRVAFHAAIHRRRYARSAHVPTRAHRHEHAQHAGTRTSRMMHTRAVIQRTRGTLEGSHRRRGAGTCQTGTSRRRTLEHACWHSLR
jgi:hypothetical protein